MQDLFGPEFMLKIIEIQTFAMLANIEKTIRDDTLTDPQRIKIIERILTEMPDISNIQVVD